MIRFQGELSKECRKSIGMRIRKFNTACGSIGVLVVVALLTPIWATKWWLLWVILPSALAMISVFWFAYKKDLLFQEPQEIIIDDDGLIAKTKMGNQEASFESIKFIKDEGGWYTFVFGLGMKSHSFVCQKDLLVEGTLEEFEELFADKIERV